MRGRPGTNTLAELPDSSLAVIWDSLARRVAAIPGYDSLARAAFPGRDSLMLTIADVGNALNPLVFGGFGNLLDKTGFPDLKGNARQNDRTTVAAAFFDFMACAHHDGALALAIGGTCASLAEDQWTRGKIGCWDNFDQFIYRDRGIVDIGKACLDDFA